MSDYENENYGAGSDSGQYNYENGQNQYNYGSTPSQYNYENGQNQYNYGYGPNPYGGYYNGYGGAEQVPMDKKGRPIKNRFALKLVFSIIEFVVSPLFAILAIIFTCLQNSNYNKKNWKDFKTFKTLSTVFLWIGYAIGIILTLVVIVAAIVFANSADSSDLIRELLEEAGVEEDYDYYDESYDEGIDLDSLTPISIDGVYEVSYNGADLEIPMAMSDVIACGKFDFETDPSEIEVESGYTDFVWFGTDYWEMFYVYNDTDQTATADQLQAIGLSLVLEDGDRLSYLNGQITQDTSAEDAIAVLGEDYAVESGTTLEEEETTGYCWSTGDGYIELWYYGDQLYTLDIEKF